WKVIEGVKHRVHKCRLAVLVVLAYDIDFVGLKGDLSGKFPEIPQDNLLNIHGADLPSRGAKLPCPGCKPVLPVGCAPDRLPLHLIAPAYAQRTVPPHASDRFRRPHHPAGSLARVATHPPQDGSIS